MIELSVEITRSFKEIIHDPATFLKLFLVMDDLFEHLPNFKNIQLNSLDKILLDKPSPDKNNL